MARSSQTTAWVAWITLIASVILFWGVPLIEGPHELVVRSVNAQ